MSVSIDRIVNITVDRNTRSASRRSFGVALIAAYHTAWLDRVREYADPSEMLTDGFTATHPAYLAAVSLCSQSPRPSSFKIGRRIGTPDQTVRFTPATPAAAEVFEVTIGGVVFQVIADSTPTVAEVCAAFVLLINADADAVVASGVATTATIQNIVAASYNGVRGAGPYAPARNITLTLNNHADWDASTITVTGTDDEDRTITEAFTVPNGGNTVLVGTKYFKTISNINIPAQSGVGGTLLVGLGDVFGDNPNLDITATDSTTHFETSADDAGAWFGYTDPTSNLALEDRTSEPATTLAVDLGGIHAADADWIALCLADGQSQAQIEAAAAWVETQDLVYLAHSFDSEGADATDQDVMSALLEDTRMQTTVFYSPRNHGRFPDAAVIGAVLPGSAKEAFPTWAFKALSGIEPDELSTTEVTRLIGTPSSPQSGKRALIYVSALPTGTNVGTPITMGGLTAGGEWLDVVLGLFYLQATIQEKTFNLMLQSPKVPFTAAGIDAFVGAVRAGGRKASSPPYNVLDPASLVVEFTKLEDVDPDDKQARFYDGAVLAGKPQGAIHAADVRVQITP